MDNDEKRKELETAIACGGMDKTAFHYNETKETVRVRTIRRTSEYASFLRLVEANETDKLICTYTGKPDEWLDTVTLESQLELLEAVLDLNFPLVARYTDFLPKVTETAKRAMTRASDAAAPALDSESAARLEKLRNALDQRKST